MSIVFAGSELIKIALNIIDEEKAHRDCFPNLNEHCKKLDSALQT